MVVNLDNIKKEQGEAVKEMMNTAAWKLIHAELDKDRENLITDLIKEENPETRATIKGIDRLFASIDRIAGRVK